MSDRKTIGLTQEGRAVVDRIQETFRERMQAAQFAMALVLAEGGEVGDVGDVDTAWNVGSFDSEGQLRAVVLNLYPTCAEPYRLVEQLVNEGLRRIGQRIDGGEGLTSIFRAAITAANTTAATSAGLAS